MASPRTIKAWHHAKHLAVQCSLAARRFPADERPALASQLRRAAYGAVLNIAEGAAKRTDREYRRYLDTARASLHEVETILCLAAELGYINKDKAAELEAVRTEAAKTLFGLLRAVTARLGS